MTDLVLSVSQAETYDPEQPGGCPRRWWFERVDGRERTDSASAEDGIAGHVLLAAHLRGQPLPKRARMLKAVRSALHHLPPLWPGLLVESRFDGQPSHTPDGQRVQLNREHTLWLGGVPWDGYVDLRWHTAGLITVWDHKFSSDIDTYARPADQLIRTIQMPIYALDSLRVWPDAERFRLVHLYMSRRGVHSFIREQTVTREQIAIRIGEISALVVRIQETARATSQEQVEANRKACHAYGGCPHQSVCTAFRRKPVYQLTPEEEALFGPIAAVTGEKPSKELDVISQEQADAEQLEKERLAQSMKSDGNPGLAAVADQPLPDVSIPLPQASMPPPQPVETPRPSPGGVLAQCPDCPHPAHPGAQCTGKRGRGQCRCGATGAAPAAADAVQATLTKTAAESIAQGDTPGDYTARIPLGAEALVPKHLPTCVQSDGGKWLCMEGCTAGQSATEPRQTGGGGVGSSPLRVLGSNGGRTGGQPYPGPSSPHPLSGTLRVEVGLDWGTHQLIERLISALKR